MNERREHSRMTTNNLTIDVTDGIGAYKGRISDISRTGICMVDLPKKLNVRTQKLIAVISSRNQHFKMGMRPKWFTEGDGSKSVGTEILNPPWEWMDFVIRFEPTITKDVWDEIRL
jgi:hypothetical protein